MSGTNLDQVHFLGTSKLINSYGDSTSDLASDCLRIDNSDLKEELSITAHNPLAAINNVYVDITND